MKGREIKKKHWERVLRLSYKLQAKDDLNLIFLNITNIVKN